MPTIVRRQNPESAETVTNEWQSVPSVLKQLYINRGITSTTQLNNSLQQLLPYDNLKGIDDAVDLLVPVVTSSKTLLVVGDFDVDGATSTALALRALRAMGAENVSYLVPDRFDLGYGLTPELVSLLADEQPDLIMTVDNGIAAVEGVAAANQLGIEVLVTDHHLPGDQLPDAAAIVNPNQQGCEFPSKAACGCAVVFYCLLALRSKLMEIGYFGDHKPQPNMAQWLDLVALATVADVVPLDQNNRILVEQGLRRIRAGKAQVGINALLQLAKKNHQQIVSTDLGFAIGPRLNAAGRLDDMSIGIECLLTDDALQALTIAETLDNFNRDRRQIEQGMQQQALALIERLNLSGSDQQASSHINQDTHQHTHKHTDIPPNHIGIALLQSDWHQGVIGILAARIKEKLYRPVIACCQDKDQQIKGSARSIPGIHIRDVLDLVDKRLPGALVKFGGHAMAAGMTIREAYWNDFQKTFDAVCREQVTPDVLQQILYSDGSLAPQQFNLSLAEQLRFSGPWGQGFPEPVFDGVFAVTGQRVLGEKHLKLQLRILDEHTMQLTNHDLLLDAIWFNADLTWWQQEKVDRIHCAFQLDVNDFRGRQSVQLIIRHAQAVNESVY